jgi:prepilin-type N-terminal cleavage/methylation domain-containing protein
MIRRAFTLVEILAAVTLAAALVTAGGIWLLGVQRSAQATRHRSADSMALTSVAVRLRDDLIHATSDRPIGERDGQGSWLLTVAGRHGGARRAVTWSLRDGVVVRSEKPVAGGTAISEMVATRIDALEIRSEGLDTPTVHISAGTDSLDLAVAPGASRAP